MEVAITGLGMVTAVGSGATAACAAIRAGVSRPEPIDSVVVLDPESNEETSPTGHPVSEYCEGFAIAGVWLRLALGALEELGADAHLPDDRDLPFWARTALLVVTPASLVERFGEGADNQKALRSAYLDPLADLFRQGLPSHARTLVSNGHAGTFPALERARHMLESHAVDRVIVAAADSFLDDLSLGWLVETDRLHSDENPVGLVPGEASAAVLLEVAPDALRRGARPDLLLEAVATDLEPRNDQPGLQARRRSQGIGLARAVSRCLADRAPGSFDGDLVVDLNGETWRAYELAMARVASRALSGTNRLVIPALSLGETGAASGVLSLCVGARSLTRGYARGAQTLVLASSEDGHVGATRLALHSSTAARGTGVQSPR